MIHAGTHRMSVLSQKYRINASGCDLMREDHVPKITYVTNIFILYILYDRILTQYYGFKEAILVYFLLCIGFFYINASATYNSFKNW